MRPFWLAFGLLTRLQVPDLGDTSDRERGAAVGWFPLVGLVIGLSMAAADTAARWAFGPLVASCLAALAGIVLTGGLHLDGLMDTADACLPPFERERRLEILRDSRVGAFGVVAGVVVIVLKVVLIAELYGRARLVGLILAPALARWGLAYAVTAFDAARPEGMAAGFARLPAMTDWLKATVLAALPVMLLLPPMRGLLLMGAVFGVATMLCGRINRQLGGLTGDGYGAVTEIGEVAALAAMALVA